MKTTAQIAVILTSAGLCTGLAGAAEISGLAEIGTLSGKVMVYNGIDYRAAETGMPLTTGHQVLTLKDGKADVAFQAGCVINLEENAVLTIPEASVNLCVDGKFVASESPVTLVHAAPIGAPPDNSGKWEWDDEKKAWVPVGVGLGLIGAVALIANDDDDNNNNVGGNEPPISPQ